MKVLKWLYCKWFQCQSPDLSINGPIVGISEQAKENQSQIIESCTQISGHADILNCSKKTGCWLCLAPRHREPNGYTPGIYTQPATLISFYYNTFNQDIPLDLIYHELALLTGGFSSLSRYHKTMPRAETTLANFHNYHTKSASRSGRNSLH